MKKIILLAAVVTLFTSSSCKKSNPTISGGNEIPSNFPRTEVPADLRGLWMYGNFSTTEYWSQDPSDYLGNALEFAIAFKFNSDGTFEQYFTSSSVTGTVTTYQQSVTKGTVEVDPVSKKITAHAFKAHYRRTQNGQIAEERDLSQNELNGIENYAYETGTENNGTPAVYLTLDGTTEALPFLKKQ